MINLETEVMGLKLKNPLIVGSSGLTNSGKKIRELESNGAAAVVLKSIFEEQILREADSIEDGPMTHPEEHDYIKQYTINHNVEKYLELIKKTKKEVNIPVIASVHCFSPDRWTYFSKKIEDSGVDAIELNIFIIPRDFKQKGEEIENIYFDIIDKVKRQVSIPVSLKVSYYFSGLANMLFKLSLRGLSGMVLFNRFHSPDIDLKNLCIVPSYRVFSTPEEFRLPLRWIGMVSERVKCDLVASTGIHDGNSVVKCLLAGAKAVQIASVLYQKGPEHVKVMLKQIEDWMKEHKFKNLKDFIGKLSQGNIKNPLLYERAQFMKYNDEKK